jgi:hypothetical protein
VCRIERATSCTILYDQPWRSPHCMNVMSFRQETRIAHEMLSNPTLQLIRQRPVRPADQTPNVAFCIALTRFDDRIENSAEAATALTPRRRCRCAYRYFSSHASAYRKRPNKSEMKLSDDLIALADKTDVSCARSAEKTALDSRKLHLPTRACSQFGALSCLFRGLHPHRTGSCEF